MNAFSRALLSASTGAATVAIAAITESGPVVSSAPTELAPAPRVTTLSRSASEMLLFARLRLRTRFTPKSIGAAGLKPRSSWLPGYSSRRAPGRSDPRFPSLRQPRPRRALRLPQSPAACRHHADCATVRADTRSAGVGDGELESTAQARRLAVGEANTPEGQGGREGRSQACRVITDHRATEEHSALTASTRKHATQASPHSGTLARGRDRLCSFGLTRPIRDTGTCRSAGQDPSPNPLTEGTALYGRGDFAGALDKFQAAYKIYPSPKLQFNIAQADRDLGRPLEAMEAFSQFLAQTSNAAPELLSEAQQSVAELESKLGRLTIRCETPDSEVAIDGKTVGITPLAQSVWTMPGRHQIVIRHQGYKPITVTVAAGEQETVVFESRPLHLPAPQAAAPPESAAPAAIATTSSPSLAESVRGHDWFSRQRWYVWLAAGGTVAFTVGAIITGLYSNSLFDKFTILAALQWAVTPPVSRSLCTFAKT